MHSPEHWIHYLGKHNIFPGAKYSSLSSYSILTTNSEPLREDVKTEQQHKQQQRLLRNQMNLRWKSKKQFWIQYVFI